MRHCGGHVPKGRARGQQGGWPGAGPDVGVRSVRLLERAVPDFNQASHGRLEGREVTPIDATLRQPSGKHLEQSLPLVGGPRLRGNRDLYRADRRLLDLDQMSHDPDVTELLTVCAAGFPRAVSAR